MKIISNDRGVVAHGNLIITAKRNGEIYKPLCRKAPNLIVTVGYGLIAEGLGVGYYDFKPDDIPANPSSRGPSNRLIQYCALGDDASGPVVANTLLGNEEHRQEITDALREANIVYFDTFFGTDEANTFIIREAGLFGYNATVAADSGTLLSRTVSFAPIVKTANETLTFSWGITFSAG